jgi:hypothetical protein
MEPLVGGRMETVVRRPITDPGDRFRLALLLAVAVAVHGWLIGHTFVTARDGVGFARYAYLIGKPSKLPADPAAPNRPRTARDVFQQSQHPPGFPAAVFVTSQVVRLAYHPGGPHELQDQMLLAVQLTAAAGGVLLVLPTYWLGRKLFGKFAGFAAALLFQVLPVPAHVTADALTEGVYLLGLATTLLLGVRAVGKPSVGAFLQCGLAAGLTHLVRFEGVAAGAAVGLVLVGLVVARQWAAKPAAGWLAALVVGTAIPAAPYMALIGGVSNKPSVKNLWDRINGSPREQMLKSWQKAEAPARPGAALLATWIPPEVKGTERVAAAVGAVAKEGLKAIHYAPALWAAVGVVACLLRLRSDPRPAVLLVFGGLTVGILVMLGSREAGDDGGYVSERHTLPLAYLGCLFAAGGLEPAARWCQGVRGLRDLVAAVGGPRWAAVWVLAALVASGLPGALKPLHQHRVGHKYAGEFLAAHATAEDVIVDPFEWAQFYCGRTLDSIPPDPATPRLRWAVDEPPKHGEVSHTRIDRLKALHDIKADGRAVVAFQWPAEVPVGKADVVVYKLAVPK